MAMTKDKLGDIETTALQVRSFDADISLQEYKELVKNPLYIILDNLRSAFNVGAIFRTCDALRVSGLFLCGYTAYPPHIKLQKTSMGTIDYVPWKHFDKTVDAVKYLQDQGIPVWAAETTSRSQSFYDANYPGKLGLVFGNEALGVSRQVVEMCDNLIEIPQWGFKNSLNVAISCGIIGFSAVKKMVKQQALAG
ncbi:MAG: RNA methyltransferase [Fibrobacter sp.]|jgi:23S rRNA (guanosine2251-2'-O)-methyltransferase|nr:RNA methyltransferase [Fibrobacter sp.]